MANVVAVCALLLFELLDVVPVVPPPHALKTKAISTDDVNQVNKRISKFHHFYQFCNGMSCGAQGASLGRLVPLDSWHMQRFHVNTTNQVSQIGLRHAAGRYTKHAFKVAQRIQVTISIFNVN